MKHGIVGVAALLGIAAALVTACTAGSGTSADSAGAGPAYEASGGGAGEPRAAETAEQPAATAKKEEVSQPGVDRKLVRTATVELVAADVVATVDRARDIAVRENGYAGREQVRDTSATLTLHIPSDRFDQALDALSALGEVVSREQSAEDVTEEVVDLDSRVATQRASVDRVRALLAKANTVDEIVRIEQEVTAREAELESLQQRSQALAGQVAMSTVTLSIGKTAAKPAPAPEPEERGFLAGLSAGWDAFLGAGGVTLQVIGAVLPFLLVLGIPAALVLRWWRRRRTPVAQQP
ncbi:DUF4349 domain-containing protein [Actinophytocola sp. KF-1]